MATTYETQLGLLAALEPPRLGIAVARVVLVEVATLTSGPKGPHAPSSEPNAVITRVAIGVAKARPARARARARTPRTRVS